MLTEAEIEELLANVCRHSVMTDAKWRATVAHAIAERLKEGVVWEDLIRFEVDDKGDLAGWSLERADYSVYMPDVGSTSAIPLGECLRVTVTAKSAERDGDG